MKLRLGAAVLAAALVPFTAAIAPSPASAGEVDITPPEVGSCHALTLSEGFAKSDPDPAVACEDAHTSLTFKVVTFTEAPSWRDLDALDKVVTRECVPAYIDALGGSTKVIRRAAHSLFWFIPTKAHRDAGATWLRCDLVLLGGDRLMRLPQDVDLGGLPLDDSVAKCRKGRAADFAVTVCTRGHQFRATHSIRLPHASYPGARVAERFAIRECRERIPRAGFYYEFPANRASWRSGYRHAVCLKETTR